MMLLNLESQKKQFIRPNKAPNMVARHSFESERFAECEECFDEEQVDGKGLCESCSEFDLEQQQPEDDVEVQDKVRNLKKGLPSNWTLKQVNADHTKPCTDCSTDGWSIGDWYTYDHEDPQYGEFTGLIVYRNNKTN
jgi:hypothetical protein